MITGIDDTILNWALTQGLKNSQGEPFEWNEHRFLIQPFTDFSPRQAVNKSAQVGWSETMIVKAMYMAIKYKLNIIYTLPSDNFIQKFVPPKVDQIINNNDVFGKNVKGGIYLKEIQSEEYKRYLYFIGAHNPEAESKKEESSKGVAITADLKIHDEASRSDQFVMQQLTSRLANSDYKGEWYFDNPSYPKMGADRIYQKSDQMHWMVQCEKCNYWQYLEWSRLDKEDYRTGTNHCFIDVERFEFVCGKCRKALTDRERLNGQWIPKYKERKDYRGYWLSQLCYIKHGVKSILLQEDDSELSKSHFYNYVLGKPYIGSDVKLGRGNILSNVTGDKNNPELEDNCMGVDQGNTKWYVIGNKKGIFKYGKTTSWDEIDLLRKKYDVKKMVIDALPYSGVPKQWAEASPGRVWRAVYKPESDQSEIAKFSPKTDPTLVLIRREEMFDEIVDKIMTNRFPITMGKFDLEEFIDHWTSLVRIVEKDSQGNDRFKWLATDADHLAHASLYFYTAMNKGRANDFISLEPPRLEVLDRNEGVFVNPDNTIDQNIFEQLINSDNF